MARTCVTIRLLGGRLLLLFELSSSLSSSGGVWGIEEIISCELLTLDVSMTGPRCISRTRVGRGRHGSGMARAEEPRLRHGTLLA